MKRACENCNNSRQCAQDTLTKKGYIDCHGDYPRQPFDTAFIGSWPAVSKTQWCAKWTRRIQHDS